MATTKKKRSRATLGFLLPGPDGPMKIKPGDSVYYRAAPYRVMGLQFDDGVTMAVLKHQRVEPFRANIFDLVAITPEVIEVSNKFTELRLNLVNTCPHLSLGVMERLDLLWLNSCKDMISFRGCKGPTRKTSGQVIEEATQWVDQVSHAYWAAVTMKVQGVLVLNLGGE